MTGEVNMRVSTFVLGLLVCCAPAADGGTVAFPQTPYTTTQTASGNYTIALRTAPNQPPTRGEMDLLLSVSDSMHMAVDGLQLTVVPWMPAMGHGASMTPTVTPRGNGDYFVTNVVCAMPGTWELRVTGAGDDTTVISLEVQ
jgi:hypothetical protein